MEKPVRRIVIKTLRDILCETEADPKVLRTLVIEWEVPFDQVASGWIFSELAAEQLKQHYRDHCYKCEQAGVKSLRVQNPRGSLSVIHSPTSLVETPSKN